MRLIRKLVQLLKKELTLQSSLLALLVEERAKILYLKREELLEINKKKEVITKDLQDQAELRTSILKELSEEFVIDVKKNLIPQVLAIKDLDKDTRKELTTLREQLIEVSESSQKLAAENSGLLKHSLSLVSTTLSIMTARPVIDNNNYSKSGKVNSQSEETEVLVTSFNRSA